MGNPKPTRSKPCKIGRKHTGAPSLREIGKQQRGAAERRRRDLAAFRVHKAEVAKYWRNERETFPRR